MPVLISDVMPDVMSEVMPDLKSDVNSDVMRDVMWEVFWDVMWDDMHTLYSTGTSSYFSLSNSKPRIWEGWYNYWAQLWGTRYLAQHQEPAKHFLYKSNQQRTYEMPGLSWALFMVAEIFLFNEFEVVVAVLLQLRLYCPIFSYAEDRAEFGNIS
jgi:hypothetical protein